MDICGKCMGTGVAGHPDSGYTCDCNGGMTDPTPTRAEVERYDARYDGTMMPSKDGDWVSYDDYQALRERAVAAESRAYELAVAIMGGEDAPGYADSIPTQVLVDQQREMVSEWLHRVTPEDARRAEATAWNDAIEAAAMTCADLETKTNRPSRCARAIRALRRAAPTEGEA